MIKFSLGALLSASVFTTSALAATPAEKAGIVTPTAATAQVDFEIFLPLRNSLDLDRLLVAQQTQGGTLYHKWLTPAEFAASYGPTKEAWAAAKAAVTAAGLSVDAVRTRSMHVSGTASRVGRLFNTGLNTVLLNNGKTQIVASSGIAIPASLSSLGATVTAFNGLSAKHPFARISATAVPDNRTSRDGAYWYNDMKQAYDYPSYQSFLPNGTRLDGTGVGAAVLMEDLVAPGDVAGFFNHEQFSITTNTKVPDITTVLVDGGGQINGPGSVEASLDVQQILGGAPGANVTLFSIPNLQDQSILDGYQAIVDSNKYAVVNSSFGGCELAYTAAYNSGVDYTYILALYDDLFKQGNAQGITFVASSGDEGGLACPSADYFSGSTTAKFVKSVSSPADSPYVTAVGGGNLITEVSPGPIVPPYKHGLSSAYAGENAYGDPEVPYDIYGLGTNVSGGYWGAGGGRSVVFARPAYQQLVDSGSSFRTVPDVGMQVGGCPSSLAVLPCGPDRSSAIVRFFGKNYGVIGTSVSSPEFVGALVLFIQKVGRIGNANSYLYGVGRAQTLAGGVAAPAAAQFYHRNIKGFDGAWSDDYPSQNYNYLNGNGTPDVRKLFGFTNFPPAGVPRTPSNP